MKNRLRNIVITLLSFIFFLFIWQVIATSGMYNEHLFPAPTEVAKALVEIVQSGELFIDLRFSLVRIISGFGIGALLGIVLGIVSGRIKLFELSVGKIMHFLSYAPPVSLVPLFILWFGIGNSAIIPLIAWSVFFPVWFNTFTGVNHIVKEHVWAAKNLGANKFQLWKEVIFPGSLKFIVTGLRLGIGLAFIMLIVGEMAGTFAGLGYRISLSHLAFRADKMILGIIILGVLGFLADFGFMKMVKKKASWAVKNEN